ncbi:MAG: hypothetical protein U5N85_15655 [Arcicella sp.]|nr:hypothetical protein [Arcicella sp.]
MKELLNNANLIKEYGLKHGQRFNTNLDEKYSALFMQKLTESLPSLEVKFISSLSNRREEGLLLVREGAVLEGSEVLAKLRYSIQRTNVSKETFLILDTFQSAAEAYLYYKTSEFSSATKMTLQSIESQRILNIKFNHHHYEIRKIHLTVNMIRIMVSNQNSEQALAHSCNLLKYVWLNGKKCPFETDDWGHKEIMTTEEKMILSDQIINEIGKLIHQKSIDSVLIIQSLEDLTNEFSCIIEANKINLWLKTQIEFNSQNLELFFNTTTSFFKDGPEYLHYSWKHLESQLSVLDSQF